MEHWKQKVSWIRKNYRRGVALLLAAVMILTAAPIEAKAAEPTSDVLTVQLGFSPGAIVADEVGNIYVKDCMRDGQIYKYKPNGTLDTTWGTRGKTAFPSGNRGVGLCIGPDGNLITTNYDGKMTKIDIGTGAMIGSQYSFSSVTPYCCVTRGEYIYVICRGKVMAFNSDLVLTESILLGGMSEITLLNGSYGLAVTDDRIYTTDFGSVVYCYEKKADQSWGLDTTFGMNGRLTAFTSYGGGLFYNETDQKIYGSSEYPNDSKVVSFDRDGKNLNTVVTNKKSNNLYISDTGYYLPCFGDRTFEVFARPSVTIKPDSFAARVTTASVDGGTDTPIKMEVTTTADVPNKYSIKAQLIDAGGKIVGESSSMKLVAQKANVEIKPLSGTKWKAGEYKVQLLVSNKIAGTQIVISETFTINAIVAIGCYQIYYNMPTNGTINKNSTVNVLKPEGGGAAIQSITASPASGYEVDYLSSTAVKISDGTKSSATITGTGNQIVIGNIVEDISVTIAFKLNTAALDKLKSDAIGELNAKDYKPEQYFGNNWSTLEGIRNKAIQDIRSATTETGVVQLKNQALIDMANVPTLESDQTRLDAVKAATAEINAAVAKLDESTYGNKWQTVLDEQTAAINAINSATDLGGVDQAKVEGLRKIAAVPTEAAEKLETVKTEEAKKIATTFGNIKPEDYTAAAYEAIENKKNLLLGELATAGTETEAQGIVQKLTDYVTLVITKSEQQTLEAAIITAYGTYKQDDYTSENYAALGGQKSWALDAIGKATLKTDAEAAKEAGLKGMAEIETLADKLAAVRTAAIKYITDAYDAYNQNDYSTENQTKLSDIKDTANKAIGTADLDAIEGIKNKAIGDMAAVTTIAKELDGKRSTAQTALATAYQNYAQDDYSAAKIEELKAAREAGVAAINSAGTEEAINEASRAAIAALAAVKPIKILLSADPIAFANITYGAAQPEAQKLILKAATIEGCDKISIKDVKLVAGEKNFTLTGGTDKDVTAQAPNQNWSVRPNDKLVGGTYKTTLTITYDCEGKKEATLDVEANLTVEKAVQNMPETGITATHQQTAGGTGTISGVMTTMEYKAAADNTYTAITGINAPGGVLVNLTCGVIYEIRLKETETHSASAVKTYAVKAMQSKTPAPTITDQKTAGTNDGELTNVNDEMEYKLQTADAYTSITGTTVTGLEPGAYHVRYKETATTLAGADWSGTIKSVVAAPTSLGVTHETGIGADDGTITGVDDTMEYMPENAGNYTEVTTGVTTITGLTPGNYKVRYKATATTLAGADWSGTIKSVVAAPTSLGVTHETGIGADDGTITGVDDTMEYMPENAGNYTEVATGVTTITGLTPGTYKVRYKETAAALASADWSGTIKGVRAAPTGLTVTHQTVSGADDGTIIGVDNTMEYMLPNGSTYTAVAVGITTISNLTPGTYKVRYKATDALVESADAEVTVKSVQIEKPSVTAVDASSYDAKDGQIDITSPLSGIPMEYRSQGSNGYTPVAADSTVVGSLGIGTYYIRYAETAMTLAGEESTVTISTTEFSFTCNVKPDKTYGTVTLEDGTALPSTVNKGQPINIKVTPNAGYEVDTSKEITSDKCNVKSVGGNVYEISDIIGNVVINVTFKPTAATEKLIEKKNEAKASMSNALKPEVADEYLDDKTDLLNKLNEALKALNDATSIAEVATVFDAQLKIIEDAKQKSLDDFRATYASPSDAILGNKTESDYSPENWKKLENYVEKAEKALKNEKTPKNLQTAMDKIFADVNNIKTKEQETTEYQKQVEAARDKILASMSDAIPNEQEEYSETGWKKITDILEKIKEDIKKAVTLEAVDTIWEKGQQTLAKVMTAAEELQDAIEKAQTTLFNTKTYQYSEADYTPGYWMVLTKRYDDAMTAVEAAQTLKEVEKILQDALKEMKKVPNLESMGSDPKKEPEVVLLEDSINNLPPANVSGSELEAARQGIGDAKGQYDILTEEEKKQIDPEALKKLNDLISNLVNLKVEGENELGVKVDGLLGLLVDPEDIANGATDVVIKVNAKPSQGSEADRQAAIEAAGSYAKVGILLDAVIEKIVDGNSTLITQLDKTIQLSLTIPDDLRGYKNYKVVQIHDGVATVLDSKQVGNVLTVSTDLLATYVLTYETGGNNSGSNGGTGGGGRIINSGLKNETGNWVKDGERWWFSRSNGTWPKLEWLYTGDQWYHFNKDGYMEAGWVLDKNQWYFMNTSGAMMAGAWLDYAGNWYYLGTDGTMARGRWEQINSKWYYFGTDGRMAVNATVDGKTVGADGARIGN